MYFYCFKVKPYKFWSYSDLFPFVFKINISKEQALNSIGLHLLCQDNTHYYKVDLQRREIRAGRRRLRDRKPGFSIVSSVNDKVSRFLQVWLLISKWNTVDSLLKDVLKDLK